MIIIIFTNKEKLVYKFVIKDNKINKLYTKKVKIKLKVVIGCRVK